MLIKHFFNLNFNNKINVNSTYIFFAYSLWAVAVTLTLKF